MGRSTSKAARRRARKAEARENVVPGLTGGREIRSDGRAVAGAELPTTVADVFFDLLTDTATPETRAVADRLGIRGS